MRLRLRTRRLPHPFANERASAHEAWGALRLVYEQDDKEVELLRHAWDLLKLAE